MTQMGHSLVGACLGILALSKHKKLSSSIGTLFLFVVLANIPDLPVPAWGHDRYYFSHSLFVNLGVALLLTSIYLLLSKFWLKIAPNMKFLLLMILALFSHLLLDSFYNHGFGVAIFWPFSSESLALPIPWLSVQKDFPPPFTLEMLRIWFLEFLTFSPLLLLSLWYRKQRVKFLRFIFHSRKRS
jgi:membrane-bound metal-dependent hydrolase YbcI (DUF457 family)